jgi:capsular polysaccharide biosynthesis protein
MTLLIGMVVSTIGSFGVVLLSNYLDQSLKTVDEVEHKIGLPVLASIPFVRFDMEKLLLQTKQEGYRSHA